MALTDSLISYWKLDEASGTRVDSHTGGNDLTDNNTVTQAAGKIGNSAQFTNANSESLTRVDNASLSVGNIDFTWAGWFYLDSKTTYRIGFCKYQTPLLGNADFEYRIYYDAPADRFLFTIGDGGANSAVATANNLGSPSTATWYYIVGWHDASADTISIQVNNGTADSTAYASGSFDGAGDLIIGLQAGAFGWDGRMDELGFWKRVLTAAERTALYNGGSGLAYPFFTPGFGMNLDMQAAAAMCF